MSENLKTKYFSDEDKIHALIADRDQIIQTLATERDAFGKRETELMARVERLEKVAEAAKSVVRGAHRQSKENAPLEYALWESLQALRDGEGKA